MKKVVILFILLFVALPFSFAQEPGTPSDNACYEGGSLEGQCDNPAEWVCGWYAARIQAGTIKNLPSTVSCPTVNVYGTTRGAAVDNLCYAEGQNCVTTRDWTCGWVMARYQAGIITEAQVRNTICATDLPASTSSTASSSVTPVAQCFNAAVDGQPNISFQTSNAMVQTAPLYNSPNCTPGTEYSNYAIVFAAGQAAANAACQANFFGTPVANDYSRYASNMWVCSA